MNTEQESIRQTGIKLYLYIHGAIFKTTDGEMPWGGSEHMIRILQTKTAMVKSGYFKKANSGSLKSCVTESFLWRVVNKI